MKRKKYRGREKDTEKAIIENEKKKIQRKRKGRKELKEKIG